MKSGSPQLRSAKRSTLQALDQWSEIPAVADAKMVVQPPAAEVAPAPAIEHPTPTKASRGPGRPPKRPEYATDAMNANPNRPWAMASTLQAVPMKSTTFRLPNELYLKLKWLGDTTFNESMTDIVIAALEKEVASRLKERGQ